ncbi:MAG: heavy metal translocating P-type ATPase [Treponema sp.]|nr:heavy metal translocating P-type ATPase [Treponema sp.]
MERYSVSGMSCAACVARVEKAVSKVPGVTSCAVSLLTNSMGVEGTASAEEIVAAVKNAGYDAEKIEKKSGKSKSAEKSSTSSSRVNVEKNLLRDKETPVLKKRLAWSAGLLLVLMYLTMGHVMWNWPIPAWFMKNGGNHVAMGLVEMILAFAIMLINKKFFVNGFKSLFHGAPNMDTLVAMGSGISFLYSTFLLFAMTDSALAGNAEKSMFYMHNLYFESVAMIVTLITVGKLLEAISKGKTTNALESLMKLAPKTATLIRSGKETEVLIEEVKIDDIFVVRPGENIPVDGKIIEGNTAINESALTGESIPVDKTVGDEVSAGTINQSGFIKCQATRIGEDTTLSQIIQMVSDSATTKAPISKIADKVSGVFVPAVLAISLITFVIWLLVGSEFSFSLGRAISVLVVSCPCALGLATPVAIMVGNGVGAKNGILFKTSESLEETGKTQIVVLDKTGTVTKGEPLVTDVIPNQITENELIEKAASLEAKSEHPLSKAVLKKAQENGIKTKNVTDFSSVPGNGLTAKMDGTNLFGGNLNYIEKIAPNSIDKNILEQAEKLSEEGKTPLFFAENEKFLGIIAVSDVIKDDSAKAISELKNMGIKVVLLTGDNEKTANAIGKKAGVDQVIAGVLPDGKEKIVKEFKKARKTCMVGDGINDAPALTIADTGMAVGAGTDVALDAANVVLVKSSLLDVPVAIRLSRKTLKNIHENLFWAFFYNIILIPIAAGVYYHAFGLSMNPMFGAAAMSLSSFCVVTNALRLNLINIRNAKYDRKIKNSVQNKIGANVSEKTLKVEGMMCSHCEKHVKEALEKLDGVQEATADHEKKQVVVKLTKDIPDSEFEKAITEAGYTFVK